jgi:hypothetical protein
MKKIKVNPIFGLSGEILKISFDEGEPVICTVITAIYALRKMIYQTVGGSVDRNLSVMFSRFPTIVKTYEMFRSMHADYDDYILIEDADYDFWIIMMREYGSQVFGLNSAAVEKSLADAEDYWSYYPKGCLIS